MLATATEPAMNPILDRLDLLERRVAALEAGHPLPSEAWQRAAAPPSRLPGREPVVAMARPPVPGPVSVAASGAEASPSRTPRLLRARAEGPRTDPAAPR